MSANVMEKLNESVNKLFEDLQNGHTEKYIEFIKLISKFHNYSINNMFLIYFQKPEAERVAGFATWKKLGFKVKKGSQAIKILARKESVYIMRGEEKVYYSRMTESEKKNKDQHQIQAYYDYVNVFDVSQVEGDKTKLTMFTPLGDSNKEIYQHLKKVTEESGIEVIETNNTKGAEGISMGGKILIKKSIDYNNKLLTLIHEVAHEMLDKGEESDRSETTSQIRELRAESVSYIVADFLGIKNPFTVDYIKCYGNSEKELKEHLEKILKTSNKIIDMLNK